MFAYKNEMCILGVTGNKSVACENIRFLTKRILRKFRENDKAKANWQRGETQCRSRYIKIRGANEQQLKKYISGYPEK